MAFASRAGWLVFAATAVGACTLATDLGGLQGAASPDPGQGGAAGGPSTASSGGKADQTSATGGASTGGASTTGTGGGPGGSTSGGGGSGGGPMRPPSWLSSMGAAYLFEGAPLGHDASGHGLDLSERNGPIANSVDFVEGGTSLEVHSAAGSGMFSDAVAFQTPPGASYTVGGWFKVTSVGAWDSVAVARSPLGSGVGYTLEREQVSGSLGCWIGDGTTPMYALGTPSGTWPVGSWIHVVCRFDNGANLVAGFYYGAVAAMGNYPDIANSPGPFELSQLTQSFDGLMDEVFFTPAALSNAAIARIWGCGIDGHLCACDPTDPTQYASCGHAAPNCSLLTPCNQAGP